MKFNLFYEYYNKNIYNNIYVCVFYFGFSVCNSLKKIELWEIIVFLLFIFISL